MTGHTYTPTNWVDEVPASTPVKYKLTDAVNGVLGDDVTIEVVTSVTPGTPLNATTENNQETGIANAQADANQALIDAAAAQADADLGVIAYNWRDAPYTFYLNGNEVLTTTHKFFYPIPNVAEYANGAELIDVRGGCWDPSSSGQVVILLQKYIHATDTLTTLMTIGLTIDEGEKFSIDSAVQPVIDATKKNFLIGDGILATVTSEGTGVTHCHVDIVLRPIEA